MKLTQDGMEFVAKRFFLPIMLLMDYTLFLYLVSVYKPRRHEFRVRQLFLGAFIGFAVIIPYAMDHLEDTLRLNDISETCSQLMFLIQITIIGRDVQAKVKVRSIKWFTVAAEIMIFLDWATVVVLVVSISGVTFGSFLDLWGNILESATLSFVTLFRFFYLSISKGFWRVLQRRKLEFLAYVLLMTHEYPWYVAEHFTGVTWEYVQGIYMRSLIAWCIVLNVSSKKTSRNSSVVKSRTRNQDTITSKRHSLTSSMPKMMAVKSAPVASSIPTVPSEGEDMDFH